MAPWSSRRPPLLPSTMKGFRSTSCQAGFGKKRRPVARRNKSIRIKGRAGRARVRGFKCRQFGIIFVKVLQNYGNGSTGLVGGPGGGPGWAMNV